MTKEKCLVLVFPDGTSMRNWLFSSFIDKLGAYNKILVFSALPNFAFDHLSKENREKLTVFPLKSFKEPVMSVLMRYSKLSSSLHWNYSKDANPTFLRNYPFRKNYSGFYKLMLEVAWRIGKFFPNQKSTLKLEKWQVQAMENGQGKLIKHYQNILEENNADVVFNVHQREVKSLPLVLAARNLNIKSINFIYSWDNLSKGRMAVPTDEFMVWSDFMKSELQYYYPDIDEKRITVTGTPQFEFYHSSDVISREVFANQHDLDVNKKWVLYSGDMTDASPFDEYYLEDVINEINTIPEENRPQLLFRNAPVDQTGRFEKVLKKYPEIKYLAPLWRNENEHQRKMVSTLEDTHLLVNLCFHCQTAINFGSTMALDFSQFGKKVIYLNYHHPKVIGKNWTTNIFYRYTHFETLTGLDAVNWILHKKDISKIVLNTLLQKESENSDTVNWSKKITVHSKLAVSNVINTFYE